jgi:hypothetical protein
MDEPTYTYLGQNPYLRKDVVYFVYSAGRIKIGFSTGLKIRHKQLRATGPFNPTVLLVMDGSLGDDADLHVKFAADRVHGEWFNLSKPLRAYLTARLCDIGLSSLDRAEIEFRDYCEAFLASFVPPPKVRRPKQMCIHGTLETYCRTCERDRDMRVLDQLKNGTYGASA